MPELHLTIVPASTVRPLGPVLPYREYKERDAEGVELEGSHLVLYNPTEYPIKVFSVECDLREEKLLRRVRAARGAARPAARERRRLGQRTKERKNN